MKYQTSTYFFILLSMNLVFSCKTVNLFEESKKKKSEETLDSTFLYNADYQYHIRKDDKISISVWGQDEVSVGSVYGIYNSNEVYGKWLLVDANGNIEVPKIGTIQVANKTVIELKDTLKKFHTKWLQNPIVDVKVLNKKITIMGEVRDPQVIQVDEDHNTLLEMIATCKGFNFYANVKKVLILRQKGEDVHVAHLDLSKAGNYLTKNIQMYPGDVVIVPSKKYKTFDKRISTIIPFTNTITAAAILFQTFR